MEKRDNVIKPSTSFHCWLVFSASSWFFHLLQAFDHTAWNGLNSIYIDIVSDAVTRALVAGQHLLGHGAILLIVYLLLTSEYLFGHHRETILHHWPTCSPVLDTPVLGVD